MLTQKLIGAKRVIGGGGQQFIAFAHVTNPFITAYPWSRSGFGAKFANPTTLPTGSAYGIAFSPDGSVIADRKSVV